jgi:hypothetical protein
MNLPVKNKRRQGFNCVYCLQVIRGRIASCLKCDAPHHRACWHQRGGCASDNCRRLGSDFSGQEDRLRRWYVLKDSIPVHLLMGLITAGIAYSQSVIEFWAWLTLMTICLAAHVLFICVTYVNMNKYVY